MNIDAVAQKLAGNWKTFPCFAWHRSGNLKDAAQWTIYYTGGRDAGLLTQSNHAAIARRLAPFMDGDDPDVLAETHSHWAVGHLDGFAVRVFQPDGAITPAFEELCRIKEELAEYPMLDEADYTEREYAATLENYTGEVGRLRNELPPGWQEEVYSWFGDHGRERCTENRDDQGGYAPREQLVEALRDLGLLPAVVVEAR